MNFEEYEENTGWRPVFHSLPNSKNMAQRTIMPLGFFYSPFFAEPESSYKGKPAQCTKCKATIHPYCVKERQFKKIRGS